MPTTSQGIYYPDSATSITPLRTVFSTMASSIDNILAGDVQVHRVANTTERNALAASLSPSADNPVFVWRADATNGRELEYTKNGTTWHYYSSSEDTTDDARVTSVAGTGGMTGSFTAVRRGSTVSLYGNLSGAPDDPQSSQVATIPVGWRPRTHFKTILGSSAVDATNRGARIVGFNSGGQVYVVWSGTLSSGTGTGGSGLFLNGVTYETSDV